jgi:hypothetical protein
MPTISDAFMHEMLAKSKPYTLVLLKRTPQRDAPEADAVVWEHGRRNFELRQAGRLAIVCPVLDPGTLSGVGIFNASKDEVHRIMSEDPAIRAGIFSYEVYAIRSFPGDPLPG